MKGHSHTVDVRNSREGRHAKQTKGEKVSLSQGVLTTTKRRFTHKLSTKPPNQGAIGAIGKSKSKGQLTHGVVTREGRVTHSLQPPKQESKKGSVYTWRGEHDKRRKGNSQSVAGAIRKPIIMPKKANKRSANLMAW